MRSARSDSVGVMWTPPRPERMRQPEFLDWDVWPFMATELAIRPLASAALPEPPRDGEAAEECRTCAGSVEYGPVVWEDADWRLLGRAETSLSGSCMLVTREHHDSFADLPPRLLAGLGPVLARAERAVLSVGDVARVHVLRYGDGGAHFHLHLLPRPAGALQLRGTMAQLWEDLLPLLDDVTRGAALDRVAASMAGQLPPPLH